MCYKVGCDWEVNSDAEEDACGVCGGNGSACKTVKGIYSKGTTKQSGFSEVRLSFFSELECTYQQTPCLVAKGVLTVLFKLFFKKSTHDNQIIIRLREIVFFFFDHRSYDF